MHTTILRNSYPSSKFTGLRDSFKLLQKQNQRYVWDFYYFKNTTQGIGEIILNHVQKGSSQFFKTTSKAKQNCPRYPTNHIKNRTKGVSEVVSKYLKNKSNKLPEILPNYFKNQTQEVPGILSNYFKNKTKGIHEILSKYHKKRSTWDSFKLLQKQNKQVLEILPISAKTR